MNARTAPKSMSSTVADGIICFSVSTSPKAFSSSCSSQGDGAPALRPRLIQSRPSHQKGSHPRCRRCTSIHCTHPPSVSCLPHAAVTGLPQPVRRKLANRSRTVSGLPPSPPTAPASSTPMTTRPPSPFANAQTVLPGHSNATRGLRIPGGSSAGPPPRSGPAPPSMRIARPGSLATTLHVVVHPETRCDRTADPQRTRCRAVRTPLPRPNRRLFNRPPRPRHPLPSRSTFVHPTAS